MFLGGYGTTGPLDDVWVLSYANGLGGTPQWTQLVPRGNPGGRYAHTAVYDIENNRMIVFGGSSVSNSEGFLNDGWILSNANGLNGTSAWTQVITTNGLPSARYGHTAIYDSTNNQMTIFAGINSKSLSDVWVLDNADTVPVEDWMLYSTESDDFSLRRRE